MRYIERRARHRDAAGRRHWEVWDRHRDRIIATGLRLWEAARKADRLNTWHAEGLVTA